MQKIRFSHYVYEMRTVKDLEEGWIGVELYRTDKGSPQLSARVIYWDATGGFSVETMNGILPLQVLEQAIAEARAVESPPPSGCDSSNQTQDPPPALSPEAQIGHTSID